MSKTEEIDSAASEPSSKIAIESGKSENGTDSPTATSPEGINNNNNKTVNDTVKESSTEDDAKTNVNKENVSNGDLHSPEKSGKDEKDSKEFVLSNVDLNKIKDEENEKEVDPKSPSENENAKSDLLDEDDNAVDIDVNENQQPAQPKDEVENDPNFAIICSFLHQFGEALEIRPTIRQLKFMFEDYSKGGFGFLQNLFCKLIFSFCYDSST